MIFLPKDLKTLANDTHTFLDVMKYIKCNN